MSTEIVDRPIRDAFSSWEVVALKVLAILNGEAPLPLIPVVFDVFGVKLKITIGGQG